MTPTGPAIVIRRPRAGLILMGTWIGFVCLLIVPGAVKEHDSGRLVFLSVLLTWLVMIVLSARDRITAAGDTLIYRSRFRTQSWHRGEILAFTIATGPLSHRTLQIAMHTTDCQCVPLAITVTFWSRTNRIECWHSALEDWLAGEPVTL